ncbi:Gfo/Idh/MocA family protein [Botrimarina mediterranea]|uniref:1,5-anhydro-D-fructose reductase n=1 Tax=Botrimarina mediterranea TaxID=2528022 RepID=A0A518K366_9BACT|nr:Gfo/Idh/MocA family oxidoreductase [Botrimarina mediterranea]QDV72210.1 1,5-anhydro-D-fructose reductase [Botrimarina mediterranea]QDV76754.1 1,5-anhydro-D-fructose reductase [Planctomycetes bacterium K2D]
MSKTINVAMIGARFMGKAHSNAYLNVGKFFDLELQPVMKSVCARDAAGTQAFADQWGWERADTDWREVVAAGDIDLVDVCTPGDTHAPIAIAAAEAGKHVFCEKPLANTLEDARTMLAAVRKAGVRHMVNFNYRRCPAVSLARQMVEAGEIGEVRQWRATYLQDWLVDADSPYSWRMDKKIAGSGAHGDLNAHAIDLARFITGDEIAQVVGDMKTFVTERPYADGSGSGVGASGAAGKGGMGKVTVDDASIFLARFASGAIGTFEATRMAPGRKNYNRFEVSGSRGTLVWNFEDMNVLEYYSKDDPSNRQGFKRIMATEADHPYVAAWWPPGHVLGYEHGFVHGVYDLLQAIANGTEVAPDFRDGAQCVAVLEAVEKSVTAGSWQTVETVE